jgi:hypothetical protein
MRNMLNSDPGGLYNAHECMQDVSMISVATFWYAISPTYVAEIYVNHCAIGKLDDLLECAPPIVELHLINASLSGGGQL